MHRQDRRSNALATKPALQALRTDAAETAVIANDDISRHLPEALAELHQQVLQPHRLRGATLFVGNDDTPGAVCLLAEDHPARRAVREPTRKVWIVRLALEVVRRLFQTDAERGHVGTDPGDVRGRFDVGRFPLEHAGGKESISRGEPAGAGKIEKAQSSGVVRHRTVRTGGSRHRTRGPTLVAGRRTR